MSYKLKIDSKVIDNVMQATDNITATLSIKIEKRWKENIVNFDNIDTENYIESVKFDKLKERSWRVYSDVPYSIYQEYGTGPAVGKPEYTPPFDKILKWVESKLGYSGDKARNVAWRVVKKIEEFGTKPRPSARNAFNIIKGKSLNISKEILEKELR